MPAPRLDTHTNTINSCVGLPRECLKFGAVMLLWTLAIVGLLHQHMDGVLANMRTRMEKYEEDQHHYLEFINDLQNRLGVYEQVDEHLQETEAAQRQKKYEGSTEAVVSVIQSDPAPRRGHLHVSQAAPDARRLGAGIYMVGTTASGVGCYSFDGSTVVEADMSSDDCRATDKICNGCFIATADTNDKTLEIIKCSTARYTLGAAISSSASTPDLIEIMIINADADNTLTVKGCSDATCSSAASTYVLPGGSVVSGYCYQAGSNAIHFNTLGQTSAPVFATVNTGNGNNELYAMNQDVESTDAVTFATVDTGQGANELYAMDQDVESTDAVTFATVNTGQGANELYDMDQNVLTTSAVTFSTVAAATMNTGQGNYELYAMNQDVESTDAVTFATVNTGQGANELYDMDQNVLTTSDVTFGTVAAATVNTGQGNNELYAMNQDVESTDAVTFATVDTGQGANELYDMDQNVLTTSDVTFGTVAAATVNTGNGNNELYAMNQDVESTDAVTFATVDTGQGANELYAMDQDVQTTDDVQHAKVNVGTNGYEVSGTKVLGAQGAHVADATGTGDIVAQFNTLLTRLEAHGLLASS